MGTSKTPGRAGLRGMLGIGGGNGGEDKERTTAAAPAAGELTVDIGALMRKKRATALLMPSGGGGGGGLGSSRAAAPARQFAMGLDVSLENPVYSPDDSLAKAASKLQSLKALRASGPRPLAASALGAAGTAQQHAAAAGAAHAAPGHAAPPPPHPCESPPVRDVAHRASQAVEAVQHLSSEDSGDAAALHRRRRSVAPGSAQKRYGSWFEGDDQELENTLHEYNRAAPAASPRMTRAQRRKSLAVDRSLALDPGLVKAALAEAAAGDLQQQHVEQAADVEHAVQQQQQPKRAGGRRKSMAALAHQVADDAEAPAEQQQQEQPQHASVAAEVAALNAELCAQLEGMVEESPDKKSRGNGQSLRDKLLQSWDGKSYYERLLEMSLDPEQEAPRGRQQQQQQQPALAAAGQQRQPSRPRQEGATGPAPAAPPTKGPGRAVAPAAASAPVAALAVQAPAATRPPALQVPALGTGTGGGGSSAAAARAKLLTPNSQRRKLNELTTSLQLLKVTSRHRAQQAAAPTGAAALPPASQEPAPTQASIVGARPAPADPVSQALAAASSKTPRKRSDSPEAEVVAGEAVAAGPPKTGGKRGGRRSATPPTEASQALGADAARATAADNAPEGQGAAQADALKREVAAAYDMLNAALADKEKLEGRCQRLEAEVGGDRRARLAAQEEAERLRRELEQAMRERQEEAAAARAAEQRDRQQHTKELAEAQAAAAGAAAAAAEHAAEAEALVQRCADAEKALASILKAANSGLKAAGSGKEEAKALADALRSGSSGGAENAPHAPGSAAPGGRQLRQSSGGRLWR